MLPSIVRWIQMGTLKPTNTQELFGHFHTKTQMKGLVGRYYMVDPMETVKTEAKRLNTDINDPVKRLEHLRTQNVGGILVVTKIADANGPGIPFLTVLATPSMATYNLSTGDAGVLLDDVWDETVLEAFPPHMDNAKVHCPLIGAQEGYSCSTKLEPKVFSLLQDSQPLLLLAGELTCATVTQGENILPRTIFFPKVCNLPPSDRYAVACGHRTPGFPIEHPMGLW
jgi:hypothetical protein